MAGFGKVFLVWKFKFHFVECLVLPFPTWQRVPWNVLVLSRPEGSMKVFVGCDECGFNRALAHHFFFRVSS